MKPGTGTGGNHDMAKPQKSVEIAGYSGGFVGVSAGDYVRVVDVEGTQIGDLFAVAAGDHNEYLSASLTRFYNSNLFPTVDQPFFTTADRPILTFTHDHSPGFHDMLFASCNRPWFAGRGMADHPNCRDNYFAAARAAPSSDRAPLGIRSNDVSNFSSASAGRSSSSRISPYSSYGGLMGLAAPLGGRSPSAISIASSISCVAASP